MESTPYFQYLIPARFKTNSTPPPACPQNFPAEKRPPLLFVARAQHLGLCTRQNPGLILVARFWSVQRKSQGLNIHKSGMMVNMTWLSPAEGGRGTHGRDLLARSEIRTFGRRAATTFWRGKVWRLKYFTRELSIGQRWWMGGGNWILRKFRQRILRLTVLYRQENYVLIIIKPLHIFSKILVAPFFMFWKKKWKYVYEKLENFNG